MYSEAGTMTIPKFLELDAKVVPSFLFVRNYVYALVFRTRLMHKQKKIVMLVVST